MFTNTNLTTNVGALSDIIPVKLENVGNVRVQQPVVTQPILAQSLPMMPIRSTLFGNPFSTSTQTIPSFVPTEINFYDPFTGQPKLKFNQSDNVYVTSNYSCGESTVNISGKKCDVDRIISTLKAYKLQQPDKFFADITDGADCNGNPINQSKQIQQSNNNMITSNVWYYVINPLTSKILATKAGSDNFYSGAGIMFFEKNYLNPTSRVVEPTVLLVQTYRNGQLVFEEMGGEIDKNIKVTQHILSNNARKEASEESQNLFMVENVDIRNPINNSNNVNRFLDISDVTNHAIYRCYFICMTGTEGENLSSLYNENRRINVNVLRRGRDYAESLEIRRFYLRDLRENLSRSVGGQFVCQDVDGNVWNIRDRTANCLRVFIYNTATINAVLQSEVVATKKITANSAYNSTTGITSFVV